MEYKLTEFDIIVDDYEQIIINDLGILGKYAYSGIISKVTNLRHFLKYEPKSILDFGCGNGMLIPLLNKFFKNTKLYGCDVSSKSIEIAKQRYSYCDFRTIENAGDLKYYEKIDCIFVNSVLHHIPQNEHEYWINGLYSILAANENRARGGGAIVIFENNMKNPLMKAFVKRTKIDENAVMLSPKYCKRLLLNKFYNTKTGDKEIMLKKDDVKLKYTYFFPWRNKFFTYIEYLLFWLPLGAHYCVYAKKGESL